MKLKSLLKHAPIAARILAGAAGGPVGLAVAGQLAGALGRPTVDVETPELLNGVMATATPKELAAVRMVEAEIAGIVAADRKDARRMAPASWLSPRVILACLALAAATVVSFMAFSAMLHEGGTSATEAEMLLVGTIVGSVFGLASQAFSFFFGQSER